jgi:hypothetical protein
VLRCGPGQTVKHLVEALGAPHTEIGRVQVNGQAVGLDYQARAGDQIEVDAPQAGAGLPPSGPRFILDSHLGQLATYLRLLGFDTVYRNDYEDAKLAEEGAVSERSLLTRDRRLLMRKVVVYGYLVRSLRPREQVGEVLRRYALGGQVQPFRRCLRCNGRLQPVSKAAVWERLEPLTKQYYDEFHQCEACGQVFWKGSHYEHMQGLLAELQGFGAAGEGQKIGL